MFLKIFFLYYGYLQGRKITNTQLLLIYYLLDLFVNKLVPTLKINCEIFF